MAAKTSAQHFVQRVAPLLKTHDEIGLAIALRGQWPPDALCDLLKSTDESVVSLAAICLGFSGCIEHCPALVDPLRHDNPRIAAAAEQGLWQLWMQAGTPEGNAHLAEAVELIRIDAFAEALQELNSLIEAEPKFAEAYHQRGLVLCLLDRYDDAEPDFRRAAELNPLHFSAILNLGHVFANRSAAFAAAREYRRALAINPRIEDIAEVLAEIDVAAQRMKAIA